MVQKGTSRPGDVMLKAANVLYNYIRVPGKLQMKGGNRRVLSGGRVRKFARRGLKRCALL